MIADLCANADCGLMDEGHRDNYSSHEEWERAHQGCRLNWEGEPINPEQGLLGRPEPR